MPAPSAFDTINSLSVDLGHAFVEHTFESSTEEQLLHRALDEQGLGRSADRARLYTLYSPESRKALAVGVVPYVPTDGSAELVGGLSVSDGGHAQAVVVELRGGTRVQAFTTFIVAEGGEIQRKRFEVDALRQVGAKRLAQDAGKIKVARPLVEITLRQAQALGSQSFKSLLGDEHSRAIHNPQDMKALLANDRIVAEIAAFVLLRTSGSACCSCSCSCWGSSSCSCSYVG